MILCTHEVLLKITDLIFYEGEVEKFQARIENICLFRALSGWNFD